MAKKIYLTYKELAIVRLSKNIKLLNDSDKKFAYGLLKKYRTHGYLSDKQWYWVEKIAPPERKKGKVYCLYAMKAGNQVKLGFSTNPESRMKAVQTGNQNKVSILWTLEVAEERGQAKIQERKLHRYCKKYYLRGEWFEIGCMDHVRRFEKSRTG